MLWEHNSPERRWPRSLTTAANRHNQSMLRHVLDARQFTREWLEGVLFPSSLELQQTPPGRIEQTLAGKRLFYLFYEPSTRTRVSFEMAATLLGASVHGMDTQH